LVGTGHALDLPGPMPGVEGPIPGLCQRTGHHVGLGHLGLALPMAVEVAPSLGLTLKTITDEISLSLILVSFIVLV